MNSLYSRRDINDVFYRPERDDDWRVRYGISWGSVQMSFEDAVVQCLKLQDHGANAIGLVMDGSIVVIYTLADIVRTEQNQ